MPDPNPTPTNYDYDLIVIGGGPAGEKAAAQVAYFGLDEQGHPARSGYKVALIEREEQLGGACINTGTLASKTLREAALFLSGFKARQLYRGIDTAIKKDISIADLMYRKVQVQERERERASHNMARHHVTRYTAAGTLLDPHTVQVTDRHGGQTKLAARFIMVATGSTPARPAIVPFNPDNVFDSDTILEMHDLPESLLVVGGGVIGSEYAGLFAALGIKVTLVHRGPRVLDFLDHEIIEAFMRAMHQMGIEIILNDYIESVTREGPLVKSKLTSGREITTHALLYASGRNGNTASLGLDKLGIRTGKYGHIEGVDPHTYQTSVPNVYAAGDVIGSPALASTSMEQGRIAMCHAFGLRYRKHLDLAPILPMGVYTVPEISAVGESEQSCQKKGIAYVAGRSRFGDHARGQIIGDTEGMVKLLFSSPEGKLLGVHVIGETAAELVHVGMACLHFGGEIDFFIESVFNYPTLGDVYKYAAFDALKQLNKVRGVSVTG